MNSLKVLTAVALGLMAPATASLAVEKGFGTGERLVGNHQDLDGQGYVATEMPLEGSKQDERITRHIRRDVARQGDLSETAKNIKVITLDGVVSLRGLVKKESESKRIEAIAVRNTGNRSKVLNELAVE